MEGEPVDIEWEPLGLDDPPVAEALAELRAIIAASHPDATFEVYEGDDPSGMYLQATVDVDDMDDVVRLFIDRMVDMQVDERLPVYVSLVRPRERVAAMLRAQGAQAHATGSR